MKLAQETISMLQILLEQGEAINSKDTHIYDVNHDSFEFVIKQAMFIIATQGELIGTLMEDKQIAEIVYKKCKTKSAYGSIVNNREE